MISIFIGITSEAIILLTRSLPPNRSPASPQRSGSSSYPCLPFLEGEHRHYGTFPIKFSRETRPRPERGSSLTINDDYHPYAINPESAIVIDTRSMTRREQRDARRIKRRTCPLSISSLSDTRIRAYIYGIHTNARSSVHNINLCAI